jgi:hypothetical protein
MVNRFAILTGVSETAWIHGMEVYFPRRLQVRTYSFCLGTTRICDQICV